MHENEFDELEYPEGYTGNPRLDFEGFSPFEMHFLLYAPFYANSPLVLGTALGDVGGVSYLRDIVCYLDHINVSSPLKLTQKGNLPPSFCRELVEMKIGEGGQWSTGKWVLNREDDSYYISLIDTMTRKLRFVTKRKNKLSVSKKGFMFLSWGNVRKFHELFKYYVREFNWGYSDLYPESWIIQGGFAYTLFLLQKYGDEWRGSDYYAKRYRIAFPTILPDFRKQTHTPPVKAFENAYQTRVVERFLGRFGLAEKREVGTGYIKDIELRKTPLLDRFVKWDRE